MDIDKNNSESILHNEEEEKSPILGSWRNVYALVIGVLIVVIISLYSLTQYYK
jgi:hypothetical protein